MARPSERSLRDLGRCALAGVLFVFIASCGETGYNVGSGGPEGNASGTAGRAGSSSAGGAATGNWGGVAGVVMSSTAGSGALSNSAGMGNAGRSNGSGGAAGFGAVGQTIGGSGNPNSGGSQGGVDNAGGLLSGGGMPSSGGTTAAQGGTETGAGGSGAAGVGGTSVTGPCGLALNPTGDRNKRRLLLRDSGVAKLALVDVENAANGWTVPLLRESTSGVPGRDLQLIGNCRVLVGTDLGYEEYDIRSGQKLAEVTTYAGTVAAQRLRNRNTLLVGVGTSAVPFQASVGIVLVELNAAAIVVSKTVYPGAFARLARPTPTATFLVANNTKVFEGDALGNVLVPTFDVNKVPNCTHSNPQVWKSLRLPTAAAGVVETAVSTGYCASLAFFRADGSVRTRITGGSGSIPGGATAVNPYFFADFQLLSNGNFLIANWAGIGAGNFTRGIPILEYTPSGALAWYWGDPAYKDTLSGIQGLILLDGLDPTKLHVEDTNGQQVPVN